MQYITPDAAPAEGGTEIYFVGQNFPEMEGATERLRPHPGGAIARGGKRPNIVALMP